MADITRRIVELRKETSYGYISVVTFIQDFRTKGTQKIVVDRCIREEEIWDKTRDLERTRRNFHSCMFADGEEYGNRMFKRYLADGYKVVRRDEFVPTEMDNR